jgi:RimJ/RimL family protein N-acetyltransferase
MIYGERIRFRGVEREDLPTFVKWLNDPDVIQGILVHNPISQAEEENWFEKMIQRPPDEHVLGIEVSLPKERADLADERAGVSGEQGGQKTWKLIGTFAFDGIDWRNHSAEFGILIGEKTYWNRGYGTEAVRLLAQHGFKTLNLNRIFLHVFENNLRAIRAYEKAGFVHEGRERQAEFRDGKYMDVLRMSMLKDEF